MTKQNKKEEKEKPSRRQRLKEKSKKMRLETRKAVVTAIIAAFGFLIALVWKEVITEYVDTLVSISPVQGTLISAIIVTLIAIIGIMIISRWKVEEEGK